MKIIKKYYEKLKDYIKIMKNNYKKVEKIKKSS